MLMQLGFSTKQMFLILGLKLSLFQGPRPYLPHPLCAAPAPCPRDCRSIRRLRIGQSAPFTEAVKALLWWRGSCKMAAAVRSVKVDCSVPLTFVFYAG